MMRSNALVVKRSTFWIVLALLLTVVLILIIGAATVDAKPAAECSEVCIEWEKRCPYIQNGVAALFASEDEIIVGACTMHCIKTENVCPQTCEAKVLLLPDSESDDYLNESGASMLPLGVFRITCWGYHEVDLNDFGLAGRTDLTIKCRTEDGDWTADTNEFMQYGDMFKGNVSQHGICGLFPS